MLENWVGINSFLFPKLVPTIFFSFYFDHAISDVARKLRSTPHSQIILNMSISLAGVYIFFLIGGHVTGVPVLCGFSAAFLHYFMLVFFAWTAVEAIWLYMKLVKVFGTHSHEKFYIFKSGIPAWGEWAVYKSTLTEPPNCSDSSVHRDTLYFPCSSVLCR